MKKRIYFLMYDECIVHGGFFDNFEYYYIVKKVFKDCEVKWKCITSHSKDDVVAMLEDKYEGIEPRVYKDIEVIKHKSRVLHRNPLLIDVLVCATNSTMYWFLKHGNIQAAKFYIGLADWKEIHPKQNKYYKNHVVLADERVFDYGNSCKWMPYRKKILFDKYKPKDYLEGKYDYLVNLSLRERRFSKEWMMKVFKHYGYPSTSFACYSGFKNQEYYSWMNDLCGIDLIIPPVDNFMRLFNTFIYLPYSDGTDATPRLIPECVYYNKGIEYYKTGLDKKSGGYHRYMDTVNDNWMKLWLKENDEVVEHIEGGLREVK
jgi:hypothetical protein